MTAILDADGVSKRYGEARVLDGLSLSVPKGSVFGLLGPNGAGKTTFLRIVLGLVRPSAGRVALFGEPASPALRRRLGGFIEAPRFWPHLSADSNLRIAARFSGLRRLDTAPLLERVGLAGTGARKVGQFSLGMKQRLGVAAALLSSPELVILDEPTNGLDPSGIQEMRALLRTLAERDGVTVLVSSHLLDEVERTCDAAAILDHGRLVAAGPIATLTGGGTRFRLRAEPAEAALAVVGERGRRDGDAIAVDVPEAEVPALIAALVAAGVAVHEAHWERRDLESVFFQTTARAS